MIIYTNYNKLLKLAAYTLAATCYITGCSQGVYVRVINHYSQPISVIINEEKTSPIIPANSDRVLDQRLYVGGGSVTIEIISAKGAIIKKIIAMPVNFISDKSMNRTIAVIELNP